MGAVGRMVGRLALGFFTSNLPNVRLVFWAPLQPDLTVGTLQV